MSLKENDSGKECCTAGGEVMILACSGGSNVGQLANRTAVELTQEGAGRMFCLAGIGGQLDSFVQSATDAASRLVVIDGCPLGCARETLARAGVPMKTYVVLTDLGIEKNKDFNLKPEECKKAREAVMAAVAGLRSAALIWPRPVDRIV